MLREGERIRGGLLWRPEFGIVAELDGITGEVGEIKRRQFGPGSTVAADSLQLFQIMNARYPLRHFSTACCA